MMELSYVKNLRRVPKEIYWECCDFMGISNEYAEKIMIILDHLIYGVKRKINGLETRT